MTIGVAVGRGVVTQPGVGGIGVGFELGSEEGGHGWVKIED